MTFPSSKEIQVIYTPGTFGNAVRWMFDRFTKGSKFKDMYSPWDEHGRVHGFNDDDYNTEKFIRGHQVKGRVDSPIPNTDKVVLSFDPKDILFAERCQFYRVPGWENDEKRYENIIRSADANFVKQTFGNVPVSKSVAKELIKIQFHDMEENLWWNSMKKLMTDENNHNFNLYALWDFESLKDELQKVSEKYNLDFVIDEKVIYNIVNEIKNSYPVVTKDRAQQVLESINSHINMDCDNLDILEQAFIEVELERTHDSVIFPYGTNWFNDTMQIREFLKTYPTYLKHMNPRLPWYKNIKNPYHLTGEINE
jgi:hypothetical protein